LKAVFPTYKTRHIVQDVVNSVKSAAIGTAMAAVSFIAIPMLGFQKAGIPGLVAGGLAGMLYAMIFAAVGFSHAAYQLVLGAMATPTTGSNLEG
jgi:hypothetical protein